MNLPFLAMEAWRRMGASRQASNPPPSRPCRCRKIQCADSRLSRGLVSSFQRHPPLQSCYVCYLLKRILIADFLKKTVWVSGRDFSVSIESRRTRRCIISSQVPPPSDGSKHESRFIHVSPSCPDVERWRLRKVEQTSENVSYLAISRVRAVRVMSNYRKPLLCRMEGSHKTLSCTEQKHVVMAIQVAVDRNLSLAQRWMCV